MFQDDAVIFLSGVGKEMGDWKIDAPLVSQKKVIGGLLKLI
jgi:hypothetical protein